MCSSENNATSTGKSWKVNVLAKWYVLLVMAVKVTREIFVFRVWKLLVGRGLNALGRRELLEQKKETIVV